jgi:hypothetical protein
VFIDEGQNNMFSVMRELVKHKYKHMIYPEHPRARLRSRSGTDPADRLIEVEEPEMVAVK